MAVRRAAGRWAVSMTSSIEQLEIRRLEPADEGAVLELLAGSLDWEADAAALERFRWEHQRSPFGPTWQWGAFDGPRLVGLRHFLAWEFVVAGQRRLRAARAVDTVTHPEYRRRGISSQLARTALPELRAEGVDFIFNDPNDQSEQVYLSLGWSTLGLWRWAWRIGSPAALWRLRDARHEHKRPVAADGLGLRAEDALSDHDGLRELLGRRRPFAGLETRRSAEYLHWRYGSCPLDYRVILVGSGIAEGFAVVRVRAWGRFHEALLCDAVIPAGGERLLRRALRQLVHSTDVDVVADLREGLLDREGFVRAMRRIHPPWRLVCFALGPDPVPSRSEWRLTLGDLEAF